jgi:hypothetical protein
MTLLCSCILSCLKRCDGLSDRKAIKEIAARNIVSGGEQTLLKRYKRAKSAFAPISTFYDRIAIDMGNEGLVRTMEQSLFRDNKDTFLSPDKVCA